jgi:aminopeptidase N
MPIKTLLLKDLWQFLEKSSGKPVEKVMGSWTKQAGFPVVALTDLKSGTMCTQCRYYRNRIIMNKKNNGDSQIWPIPMNDGKSTYLMPAKNSTKIEFE